MSPFSVCLTFSSWVFPSSPHRSASSYLASLISCYLASLISLIFLLLFHFTLLARFLPRVARFVGNTGILFFFFFLRGNFPGHPRPFHLTFTDIHNNIYTPMGTLPDGTRTRADLAVVAERVLILPSTTLPSAPDRHR
jgi:hypothetical protein